MKKYFYSTLIVLSLFTSLCCIITSCNKDDDDDVNSVDIAGYWVRESFLKDKGPSSYAWSHGFYFKDNKENGEVQRLYIVPSTSSIYKENPNNYIYFSSYNGISLYYSKSSQSVPYTRSGNQIIIDPTSEDIVTCNIVEKDRMVMSSKSSSGAIVRLK